MSSVGCGNEVVIKKQKLRDEGRNMQSYLNELEKIFSTPMSDQEKSESFNHISYIAGKMAITFCNIAEYSDMFAEFGERGGKKKAPPAKPKEDEFEYVEAK